MRKMATTLFSGSHFPRVEPKEKGREGGREGGRLQGPPEGREGSSGPWPRALHESQSGIISHPTQYRNMPAVKLFTYPRNDSGVGSKCKSMSREGEI